jgi:hypothetical protein
MADKKISALPLKATPVVADETVIVDIDDGLNKKIKLQNLPVTDDLSTALGTKVNAGGDFITGQYTITHDNIDPTAALTLKNKDSSFFSGLGFETDNNNSGFGIFNTGLTIASPIINPGDLAFGLAGNPAGITVITEKSQGFRVVQGGSEVFSVYDGALTSDTIDASTLTIDALTTKTTPVGVDVTPIYNSTTAASENAKLSSIPITTEETTRLTNFQDSLYARYTPTVATNSTSNVLIDSVFIPGDTLSANDVIELKTLFFEKVGTTNTGTFVVFLNTSNTLTGATQIASSNIAVANQYATFYRKYFFGGGLIYLMSLSATNSDVTSTVTAWTSGSYTVSTSYYLLLAVRVANAADTIKSLATQWDRK